MRRLPPRPTRTDTLFPDTPLFRSDPARRAEPPFQPEPRCARQRPGGILNKDSRPWFHDAIFSSAPRRSPPLSPPPRSAAQAWRPCRSEEHTSELQSLMRISYAVFCLKKKRKNALLSLTRIPD